MSLVSPPPQRPAALAPQAAPNTAIAVRGLGKCYHIYNRPADRLKQALFRWRGRRYYHDFWALRGATLDIRKGEAWGIVGRNGSGKSTLLQLIAGVLTPTEGSVSVDGRVAALLELGSGFNPEFTGRENVFLNGSILGVPRREMERRFDHIAAFADIGEFLDQPVKTYSSGMFVRLAFAVAVNVEPDILIVDEALAVGDLFFQHKCVQRIRELTAKGVTLLFVSHGPDSVRAVCSKAVWLDHGKVRAIGPARDVTEQYQEDVYAERSKAVLSKQTPAAARVAGAASRPSSAGLITLRSVRVLGSHGTPVETLEQGEPFTVEVTLDSAEDLDHVSVGILIKDALGVELTGESIFNKLHRGIDLHAGTPVTVSFASANVLAGGSYSIAVRVNRVTRWDRADNVLLHNNDLSAAFRVAIDPDRPMWFKFSQDFEVTIA